MVIRSSSLPRPHRIRSLFEFLKRNKAINLRIQRGYVAESLAPKKVADCALLLMQRVLNTQSQPKLDPIAKFLQTAFTSNALRSCREFRSWLLAQTGTGNIREALGHWDGWGPKTASLFVRNLAIIEMTPRLRQGFWADVDVLKREEIEVPVDAVIMEVFARLGPLVGKDLKSHKSINYYLRDELEYSAREMLIWDDLWFWGFITQRSAPKSQGGGRTVGWNEGKYWSIPHAPRRPADVARVMQLSREFLGHLR
jgi:hypothetical protein